MCPGLKVMFFSGYAMDVATDGRPDGLGGAFLQKPFRPEALTEMVKAVLAGQ